MHPMKPTKQGFVKSPQTRRSYTKLDWRTCANCCNIFLNFKKYQPRFCLPECRTEFFERKAGEVS